MKLIELHILQSFPVTCLNRDDVGAPKSAVFGGAQRARVSSQCWKRAIRKLAAELTPKSFAGQRGHFLAEVLAKKIEAQGIPAEKANEAANQIASFLGKADTKYKEGHKTSVALYMSPGELQALAEAAASDLKEGKELAPKEGKLRKAIQKANPLDMADIALFGRMVASDHSLTVEGAGMFSHALSTHRVSNEVDFFSAVDETKPEESEGAGAGHIGTLEFSSACYYRYIGLNWDLLCDEDHLGSFPADERQQVIKTFLRACILAVPTARQNSMFGHSLPQYVLGLVRNGHPLSLVNAFEEPVKSSNGYLTESKTSLDQHHAQLVKAYGIEADATVRIPDKSLDDFITEVLTHV